MNRCDQKFGSRRESQSTDRDSFTFEYRLKEVARETREDRHVLAESEGEMETASVSGIQILQQGCGLRPRFRKDHNIGMVRLCQLSDDVRQRLAIDVPEQKCGSGHGSAN